MKIGIISDSHDHVDNIQKSIQELREREVDYILHLGDYVNPNSVREFKDVKLVGIFGNNDGDKFRLIDAFNSIDGEIKGEFHEFEEDGLKFACYHGTEPQIKDALIECGKYDVFLYGHTHKVRNEKVGKTLVLNPGTVHGFEHKPTIMIFDTQAQMSEVINL
jgi:putative phosphoesterase